jgi:hypothetical protein
MVDQEKGRGRIHVRILWVSKRLSIFLEVKRERPGNWPFFIHPARSGLQGIPSLQLARGGASVIH